jgi:hypothetical protein
MQERSTHTGIEYRVFAKGSYWTNRDTKREVRLDRYSNNIYGSYEEAK